ncbi:MAG: type II toxin-antitoxin system HicA family toxin [Eubacterium sp.]|nr:type II toxin-antitoxin system HicA family toxin [Eubacterium sp.]
MKTSELTKMLRQNGCFLVEHGAEHDKWYSPLTDKYFRVPRHPSREIKSGTAQRIMKDAGLK